MPRQTMMRVTSTLLLGLLLLPSMAQAQVSVAPAKMNFQGRLTRPDGTPVSDGTYSVRFSLHDALTGGTEKWNQTVNNVAVRNGTFAALLDVNTAGLFNGDLYLEVKIGTDAPLTPRQQLVSVPYAMKANSVPDGSIGAAQIANGSITGDKLANNALNNLSWLLGGNAASAGQFLGTTNNQPLVFKTNNQERLRISNDGKVGIGTTTPVAALSFADMLGSKISLWGQETSHYGIGIQGSLLQLYTPIAAADIAFGYGSSAAMTETMRVRGNGNVSVAVGLNVGQSGLNDGTYPDLRLGASGSGEGIGSKRNTGDNQYGLDFYTNSLPRLSITLGGNVGIGTKTPAAPLEVRGNTTSFQVLPGSLFGTAQANAVTLDVATVNGTIGIWDNLSVFSTATVGGFRMAAGAEAGKVLTSDASGNGTWGNVSVSWNNIAGIPGRLGGFNNNPSGANSLVAGGNGNTASGFGAAIVGGYGNTAGDFYTSVGGGTLNNATGTNATIAGGRENTTGNEYAFVGGGLSNGAGAQYATVAGGNANAASGQYAVVAGGYENSALNLYDVVGGGRSNIASGNYAFVGGGQSNGARATGAVVAGGTQNAATGANSAIVGGLENDATNHLTFVGGGEYNVASGYRAAVLGGYANYALGDDSVALGHFAYAAHAGTFVWGDQSVGFMNTTGPNQFLIRAGGGVGINTNNPSGFTVKISGTLAVTNLPFADKRNVQWDDTTGQFFYDNSSRRHKENITPLQDDFLKLLLAEPRTYTRPGAPDRWEIGFIAEEFDDLGLKKLVDYGEKGEVEGINYEKICVYLTAIARRQEDRLKTQGERVQGLEAENAELKARLDAIERALVELKTNR